jgi:hypothetical protein
VADDAGNRQTGVSVAGSAFGGYQWWLGPGWSLGIAGVLSGVPTQKMTDSNRNDTGYRMMGLSVGVEWLLLNY